MAREVIKDGNTTLIWNDDRATRDPKEIQEILDDIADSAKRNIVAAAVGKEMNTA